MQSTSLAIGRSEVAAFNYLRLNIFAAKLGAVSPFCATQSLTVANCGSVTLANIGMMPDVLDPVNGTIIASTQTEPGHQTLTYAHNGNTATSDSFVR